MQGNDTTEYEIRVTGHLDARWSAWFDGLRVTNESDGTTIISGPVVDQAALHGVLQKLRDVGMPLVSITQKSPNQRDALKTATLQSKDPARNDTSS